MAGLPPGFGLHFDRHLGRFSGGTVLTGGRPGRLVALTPDGADALDAVVGGAVADPATAELAQRLVAYGIAHPSRRPGTAGTSRPTVTVVVPVHDRPAALARCLSSLRGADVVVVDDGSGRPDEIAALCDRHGARLLVRSDNGGPAAARTDGLAAVDTELVAFVDSDCTVPEGWLDGLDWLFEDPTIGAVAPRVRPARSDAGGRPRVIDRFSGSHSPLDLGPDAGEVGPGRAVPYVPTTTLVVRRRAVLDVGGFDLGLRVGEDVDLVWRLVAGGWRVRYEPSVTVRHDEPTRWSGLLRRRLRYGTSAAPLSERHPGLLAPVELRPWPTVAAVAVLAGRPRTAALAVALSATALSRRVRPLGIPRHRAWRWSAGAAGWTLVGIGRAGTVLALPAVVALAVTGRRGARAALILVLAPPIVDFVRRRPDLDLPRWVVASVADDVAYGAGVWTGCVRTRTVGPLLPRPVRSTAHT